MRHFEELAQQEKPDVRFTITSSFKLSVRSLSVSVLRTAYLAAFAWFGYKYALNTRLNQVREQLQNPDATIIPPWALFVHSKPTVGLAEPQIAVLTSPSSKILRQLDAVDEFQAWQATQRRR